MFGRTVRSIAALVLIAGVAHAGPAKPGDLLVKTRNTDGVSLAFLARDGAKVETLGHGWSQVRLKDGRNQQTTIAQLRANPNVVAVQPNYTLYALENYRIKDAAKLAEILKSRDDNRLAPEKFIKPDNPDFPSAGSGGSGADTMADKQWGMIDNGTSRSWGRTRGEATVVAVIDTGVDYTHEDLVDNMWRNPGETGKDSQGRDKATNGVDDDGNGFIDDVVGWDFAANDNKPFDLAYDAFGIIQGGNPGHGTHCAGNVGARGDNGKGIAGVAPMTKIMAIRFLTEKGQGTTADAIKSINYAVKMGAKVLSNSWGSEGDDPNEKEENKALHDSIMAAQDAGALFIAAAGNGHNGVGYDNDSDANPGYPASYDHENIISVAALDKTDKLGSFSNWGLTSVDLGAPGVDVFSTMVGNNYNNKVVDLPQFGIVANWDGTSMATPHVAGAAALYWAAHPKATWREVKQAIMSSTKAVAALKGKSVTGGKLNVENLMR